MLRVGGDRAQGLGGDAGDLGCDLRDESRVGEEPRGVRAPGHLPVAPRFRQGTHLSSDISRRGLF